MENIKNVLIGVLITLLLISSFYWYELRPSFVYKDCGNKIAEILNNKENQNIYIGDIENNRFIDTYFKICLSKKGIKTGLIY